MAETESSAGRTRQPAVDQEIAFQKFPFEGRPENGLTAGAAVPVCQCGVDAQTNGSQEQEYEKIQVFIQSLAADGTDQTENTEKQENGETCHQQDVNLPPG